MNVTKLALGTAQFGLDYGIANINGKPKQVEVQSILNEALSHGVTTLDTAIAYGNCEAVLGAIGIDGFNVMSKLPYITDLSSNTLDVTINSSIESSIARLGVTTLDAVLLHQPRQLLDSDGDRLFKALQQQKENGLVGKVGISVYTSKECQLILDRYDIDVVQIPLNIIDGRWGQLIAKMKQKNISIHARSVFLQGLLVMDSQSRPHWFKQWSKLWDAWGEYLSNTKQKPIEACVRHVFANDAIDKVIIGVDSAKQFKMILAALDSPAKYNDSWMSVQTSDELLLNPSKWPKF